MRVSYLKEILGMYPDDMCVYVRTNDEDWAEPLTVKKFSIMPAYVDDRTKVLEGAKLLITSFTGKKP